MNRFAEINEQYERLRVQMRELKEEYKDKIKGDVYLKRQMQIEAKATALIRKAKQIGTDGNICYVHGKRSRPSIKNPRIMIQESFNLYFVNVSEVEASALVKLHVKNTISYTIKFIRPGLIITS